MQCFIREKAGMAKRLERCQVKLALSWYLPQIWEHFIYLLEIINDKNCLGSALAWLLPVINVD